MLSLREALVAFRRAPLLSALSVTTIAFSLFAFGLFGLVVLNIRQALDKVEERVEIRAFVDPSTSTEALALAAEQIAASPDVLSTAIRMVAPITIIATKANARPSTIPATPAMLRSRCSCVIHSAP